MLEKEKCPLVYEVEDMYVVYHAAYYLVQDSVQRLPILDTICKSYIPPHSHLSNVIRWICSFFTFFWEYLGLGASPSGPLLIYYTVGLVRIT
jgi:hypothetical protein